MRLRLTLRPATLKKTFLTLGGVLLVLIFASAAWQTADGSNILVNSVQEGLSMILGADSADKISRAEGMRYSLLSDNYTRCQGKLGIEPAGGNTPDVWLQKSANDLQAYHQAGLRYILVTVPNFQQSTVDNSIKLLVKAYRYHLVPVFVLAGFDNGVFGPAELENPTNIVAFYNAISTGAGNVQFVASTAPRYMADQGRLLEMVTVSVQVAEELNKAINPSSAGGVSDYDANVVIATPPIRWWPSNIGEIDSLTATGLTMDEFDILMLIGQNTGVRTYEQAYQTYQSGSSGSLIRQFNSQERLFARTMFVGFGPAPGTLTGKPQTIPYPEKDTLLRMRLEYGYIADDPQVEGVILSEPLFGSLSMDTVRMIHAVGNNCPYDILDYDIHEYEERSVASSCAISRSSIDVDPDRDTAIARIVCDADPEMPTCEGQLLWSRQIGLPVRNFCSNSPSGTDVSMYEPVASYYAEQTDFWDPATGIYPDSMGLFAGRLVSADGGKYTIPCLGSAINNSGEVAKALFYGAVSRWALNLNLHPASARWVVAQKWNIEVGTGNSLFAWVPAGEEEVTGERQQEPDSAVVATRQGFRIDNIRVLIDAFGQYDPDSLKGYDWEQGVCGGATQINSRNIIYGSEEALPVDMQKEFWRNTKNQTCYHAWVKGDLVKEFDEDPVLRAQALAAGRNPRINCRMNEKYWAKPDENGNGVEPVADGLPCYCEGTMNLASEWAIRNGMCTLSDIQIDYGCITYIGGAHASEADVAAGISNYGASVVFLENSRPEAGIEEFDIEGAYDAIAGLYKTVQDKMAERNLRLIFNEKLNWRGEVMVRAYAKPYLTFFEDKPYKPYTPRTNRARSLSLAMQGVGVAGTILGEQTSVEEQLRNAASVLGSASAVCKIGVNFASTYSGVGQDKINEAGEIGYSYGQIIVLGPGDSAAGVGATMSTMCNAGIVPVVRSCVIGTCGFTSGADQAAFLSSIPIPDACGEVYMTCGHNEPNTEYPDFFAEGQWARECATQIDRKGGKVKVTTPIWNSTYDNFLKDMPPFFDGFGAWDPSLFECVAFNTYDNVGGRTADTFYDRVFSLSQFSGMEACIMETGVYQGENTTASIRELLWRLTAKSNLLFLLGFNWTNTNPDWQHFALPDLGVEVVGEYCDGRILPGGPSNGGKIPFETYPQYAAGFYQAEGDHSQLYYHYYEYLGVIDELTRALSLLTDSQLPAGGYDDSGDPVSDLAEQFAGWTVCGTKEHREAEAAAGDAVNCIGTLVDEDPLGSFLCGKGYPVYHTCAPENYQDEPKCEVVPPQSKLSSLHSLQQLDPDLVSMTEKIERLMCLNPGVLLAMLEREITARLPELTGDPFQQVYARKDASQEVWGPAQIHNISWIGGGYGVIGSDEFEGVKNRFATGICLRQMGIPYAEPIPGWYQDGMVSSGILERSYVGYALCGAAAILKDNSGTGEKCASWTKEEIYKAAERYLGACSQNGREYCSVYVETICNLYPEANAEMCSQLGDIDDECLERIDDPNEICADGQIRLLHPLRNADAAVTQPYGGDYNHSGVDYRAGVGTPVFAAAAGIVTNVESGWSPGTTTISASAGNFVKIEHNSGARTFWTNYQHLSSVEVRVGDTVRVGQLIGYSGNTGRSSGPHLHFELRLVDCYDGYNETEYEFGSCSADPVPFILSEEEIAACADTSKSPPIAAGDEVCPLEDVSGAIIIQTSTDKGGSHERDDVSPQKATDIQAPGHIVVAPVAGTVRVVNPVETVAQFGDGICDYIRLPDHNPSNDLEINWKVIEAQGMVETPSGSGIFRGGLYKYESFIDDEGDYYYDGGFVVLITDKAGRLWRLVHLEPLEGKSELEVKTGDTVEPGDRIGRIYDGTLAGTWADWSVKPSDGSGCFNVSAEHMHFAIISANAVDDPIYTGNNIDSTSWVREHCGL